eukprot:8931182-Alexandrium_andersonii.AAC.1
MPNSNDRYRCARAEAPTRIYRRELCRSAQELVIAGLADQMSRRALPMWRWSLPISVSYTHLTLPTICSV